MGCRIGVCYINWNSNVVQGIGDVEFVSVGTLFSNICGLGIQRRLATALVRKSLAMQVDGPPRGRGRPKRTWMR